MRYAASRIKSKFFLFLFCFVFLLILFFTIKIAEPIVEVFAMTSAMNHVTRLVNKTVEDYLDDMSLDYNDIAQLQTDANGKVAAIRIDSVVLNRVKTGITAAIAYEFSDILTIDTAIPVGTLTGSSFFTGKGANLPLSVSYSASAESELTNLFVTRGINQTQHQIVLQVTADVKVLSWMKTSKAQVKTQITIAETVIVGSIPEIYAGAEDDLWPNLIE